MDTETRELLVRCRLLLGDVIRGKATDWPPDARFYETYRKLQDMEEKHEASESTAAAGGDTDNDGVSMEAQKSQ